MAKQVTVQPPSDEETKDDDKPRTPSIRTVLPLLPTTSSASVPGLRSTGSTPLLPEPVPGPARRHSTNLPAQESPRPWKKEPANRSFPSTPAYSRKRPFFISPFPLTKTLTGGAAGKHTTTLGGGVEAQIQGGVTAVRQRLERRDTDTMSRKTTEEFEHDLHLQEKWRRKEFPRRLATSCVGGVFVIVPMLIMSFHQSLAKSLITSCICVFLFSVTLSWTSTSDDTSLFIATAGYAAFLGVFVGLGVEGAA